MSYFESLKKTLKHIHSEVIELKKIDPVLMFNNSELCDPVPGIPPLDDEEIRKRISEMKSQLKHTRIATLNLKATVHHGVEWTQKFHYDMEDLYFDVVSACQAVEKRITQFGYCPPKLKTPELDLNKLSSNSHTIHQTDSEEIAKSVTPKLQIRKISPEASTAVSDCNKEEKDTTPVLNLELATKDYRAIILENQEKPPVLGRPSIRMSKKKRKKKKTARKLDF